jgi:ribosomal protein L16/L10AE
MKKISKHTQLKFQKKHTKFAFKGVRFTEINKKFFFLLYSNLENVPKKTRRWLYRRLAKKKLVLNYRRSFFDISSILFMDPFKKIFFRFSYPVFVSLSFFKLTTYHLELIRRIIRKIAGKRVFITLFIKPCVTILRRPNQVRMGGGKGTKIDKIVYPIYPGCRLAEVRGLSGKVAKYIYTKLCKKFSFKLKMVYFNRF